MASSVDIPLMTLALLLLPLLLLLLAAAACTMGNVLLGDAVRCFGASGKYLAKKARLLALRGWIVVRCMSGCIVTWRDLRREKCTHNADRQIDNSRIDNI